MNSYRPNSFSLLPEVVKNLLIINGLLFLAKISLSGVGYDLDDILGLHYFQSQKFQPYQLITYLFMHGDFSHLFFNMFAIWMFGSQLENYWGPKKFLIYYLITGLGAALIHYTIVHFEVQETVQLLHTYIDTPSLDRLNYIFNEANFKFLNPYKDIELASKFRGINDALMRVENNPKDIQALQLISQFFIDYLEYFKNMPVVVGASGSLFGLLLAFGMLFPNTPLYMMFIPFPIKAKYFVMGYGLIELISGLTNNPSDNVAHFAHLGGMLFGFLTLLWWKKRGNKY